MLNCFIGLVACVTDNTLYMLVSPLISCCSSVCILRWSRAFVLYLLLKLYLKFSFILFVFTYNNNNNNSFLFFAVSVMGHMVVSSAR